MKTQVHTLIGLLLAVLQLAICLPMPVAAAIRPAGDIIAVRETGSGVELQLAGSGVARVELYFADTLRVRWNPGGAFTSRRTGSVTALPETVSDLRVYDTPTLVYLVSSQVNVLILKSPLRIVVLRGDGGLVAASLPGGFVWDPDNGLVLTLQHALPGQPFFGMGERGGPINRRGRSFYLLNMDWAAYDEYSDPLYSGAPFYYAINDGQVHGVFLDNAAAPFFDFDSQSYGTVTFGALKGELDYYLLVGPKPTDVARSFGQLIGSGPLPPLWSLGYHQSRYGYQSQSEVIDIARTFRTLKIPADSLYLDIDYQDSYHQFTWNPVNFPSPEALNNTLDSLGFKRVNIFDACLVAGDPLRDEFAASDFLLKGPDNEAVVTSIFLGDVSWIDFTKPTARDAYRARLKQFLSAGISATWIDLNEPAANYMPQAVYDFGGDPRPDLEARNLYALRQAELFQQAQLELRPNTRPWVLSRSGYTGIQRYAANWGGDAITSFDSLRVSIEMSLSMGLSGQDQFGHDVGGFLGSPSAELFVRWLEFGSMIPLFRTHAMNTSDPREPWSFGEPYTSMARDIISQRYRLLPYLYSLYDEAQRSGQPVLAPTAFYFPQDQQTYSQNGDFMLGPSLLVAPVFVDGARTRQVYLPAGSDWIDYYADAYYSGGQSVEVPAPLERIPIFVRAGTILPSGPLKQYVDEPVSPSIALDIYPGADGAFTLYDDDGKSLDYRNGAFSRTRLTASSAAGLLTVSIQRQPGNWQPAPRSWKIRWHLLDSAPRAISMAGLAIPEIASGVEPDPATGGWHYDRSRHLLTVNMPGQLEPSQLVITLP